jgi:hypothetical protein
LGDEKMKELTAYENYPMPIVLLSNSLTISIYAIGVYIMVQCGIMWAVLYLLYCGGLEIRLLRYHCVNCFYYGKVCAFGKGKLSSLLFKKGDPQKFVENQIRWLDLVPDLLVLIFPLIGGIVLLVTAFSWVILALLIVLLVLSFTGNAFIRGSYACKYCKQKELGCPAEQLFNKKPVED